MARTTLRIARVLVLLGGMLTVADAAELRQAFNLHTGVCDNTVHWTVPVWTNTRAVPVQLLSTRIWMYTAGTQWAYLTRTDGFWLAFNSTDLSGATGDIKHVRDTPPMPLPIAPGAGVVLNHFCERPHAYTVYSFVEYVEP